MHPITKFYSALNDHLLSELGSKDPQLPALLDLARQCQLSCDASEEGLDLLHRYVNESRSFKQDEEWLDGRAYFSIQAFKDLSPLDDPEAIKVLAKIRDTLCTLRSDLLLFSEKECHRKDGSAVIVLHASDFEKFQKLVNEKTGSERGKLSDGRLIYNFEENYQDWHPEREWEEKTWRIQRLTKELEALKARWGMKDYVPPES